MSDVINPHKVPDEAHGRAEHIEARLGKTGMDRDQAEGVALGRAVEGQGVAHGGGSSGGEPKKGAEHRRGDGRKNAQVAGRESSK